MSTDMHLAEAVVIGFAALTLLATIAIALIAAHLSSDFTDLRHSIAKIEERLNTSDEAEKRFRFESEMLLRLANHLYRTNSLLLAFHRRQAETAPLILNDPRQRDMYNTFTKELTERNREVVENIEFFRVLVDSSDSNVQALADKRPSKNTVRFLKRLSEVAPASQKENVLRKYNALLSRVIGIDSGSWTGR
jgi:hypothetical protein